MKSCVLCAPKKRQRRRRKVFDNGKIMTENLWLLVPAQSSLCVDGCQMIKVNKRERFRKHNNNSSSGMLLS